MDVPRTYPFDPSQRVLNRRALQAAFAEGMVSEIMTNTEPLTLREAAENAVAAFETYAVHHLAKNPPDADKAQRNFALAVMLERALGAPPAPIPMKLRCPACHKPHVDEPNPDAGWTNPPHRSHLCHACGFVWRPADVCTTGVAEIQTEGDYDGRYKFAPGGDAG